MSIDGEYSKVGADLLDGAGSLPLLVLLSSIIADNNSFFILLGALSILVDNDIAQIPRDKDQAQVQAARSWQPVREWCVRFPPTSLCLSFSLSK